MVTGSKGWAPVGHRGVLRWGPVPKSPSRSEGSDAAWVWRKAGPAPLQARGPRCSPPPARNLGPLEAPVRGSGSASHRCWVMGEVTHGGITGARSLVEEGFRELG